MIHIIPAVIIQLLLSPIDWWFGALFASGYYLGREMAQAEYRVIQQYYDGRRSKMPWYGAFEARAWDRKALLDWVLPTIVTMIIATFMGLK
jgi:hypothetical protein